jgi:hypothetical protein
MEYECLVFLAQRDLRSLKTIISSQSKNNFMRERDVRFLDSRIGLLIQSRMALDEVSGWVGGGLWSDVRDWLYSLTSKTKLFLGWKNKTMITMIITLTIARCNSMAIYSTFYKANLGIWLLFVDWWPWQKSTPCFKLSCLHCMGINMKVVKSICFWPCSRYKPFYV